MRNYWLYHYEYGIQLLIMDYQACLAGHGELCNK